MPSGKGTYGSKRGRPPKKRKYKLKRNPLQITKIKKSFFGFGKKVKVSTKGGKRMSQRTDTPLNIFPDMRYEK